MLNEIETGSGKKRNSRRVRYSFVKPPKSDRISNRLLATLTKRNDVSWKREDSMEMFFSLYPIQRHPVDANRIAKRLQMMFS